MTKPFVIALAGVAVLSAARTSAPRSPCLTDSPAAGTMVAMVVEQLSIPDSVDIVAAGLPYNPSGATIEDSASVCSWVIDSVNAQKTRADSSYATVSEAFIVRVGDLKVYAGKHPRAVKSLIFYNPARQYVVEVLGLD